MLKKYGLGSTLLLLLFVLGGCSFSGKGVTPQRLDLGTSIPADLCQGRRASVQLLPLVVAPQYTSNSFIWRKEETGVPNAYAMHEWIAPMGALMQQLVQQCLSKGEIAGVASRSGGYQLQLMLDRAEHLFVDQQSFAVLNMRVFLYKEGKLFAQHRLQEKQAAGTNAIEGAAAMRIAFLRSLDNMTTWLAQSL